MQWIRNVSQLGHKSDCNVRLLHNKLIWSLIPDQLDLTVGVHTDLLPLPHCVPTHKSLYDNHIYVH